MSRLDVIDGASLAIEGGRITRVGSAEHVGRQADGEVFDAEGGVILPGWVDPHTHAVFAESREEEFLARCQGTPYGRGILTSTRQVRAAEEASLAQTGLRFVREMMCAGTTTVEIKSGYGLETESELKLLRAIRRLSQGLPIEVVATFLGAHAIPEGRSEAEYVEEITGRMLPAVAAEKLAEFCDVFCEAGFFGVASSRTVLEAGRAAGLEAKIHADELSDSGGAVLAGALGATSADHLLYVSEAGIEAMKAGSVIPTLLPGTAFTLGLPYAPGRRLVDAGLPVALASDFNPGTCLIHSMATIVALAVMKMRMTIEEAITAATLNGAAALGRAGETGTLEVGKRADLVVHDLGSYRQLPYFFGHDRVRAVFAAGRLVYRRPDETP
jgi:imidazolonepropionase